MLTLIIFILVIFFVFIYFILYMGSICSRQEDELERKIHEKQNLNK